MVLVGRMNDSIASMKGLTKRSPLSLRMLFMRLVKSLVSDRYVNSLYNFNEMSVRQELRMKNIVNLRGVILIYKIIRIVYALSLVNSCV